MHSKGICGTGHEPSQRWPRSAGVELGEHCVELGADGVGGDDFEGVAEAEEPAVELLGVGDVAVRRTRCSSTGSRPCKR